MISCRINFGDILYLDDAAGGVTTYTYIPTGSTNGNSLSSITDASGNTTSFEYDEMGRSTKVINPDNTVITKTYDAKDNLISQTDENGNTTQYAYDIANSLISVTDPMAGVTGYSYDDMDNLSSVADANGNATTYEYDSIKRLLKTISPDTGTTVYSYDANGNLVSKTDANGTTVTYAYDNLNRIISISFPDPSDNITYSYDNCLNGKGRLCKMTDPAGTTNYEYNVRGQVVKETKIVDNITYNIEYSYTPNGNLKGVTYPDGRVVTYSYAANRIDSVVTTKDNITKTIVSDITYSPTSIPLSITYGNGITTEMSYDVRNILNSLNIGTLKQLSYTRDNTGNITAIINALDTTKTKTFSYDSLYRLTSAAGPWGSLNYSYDSVGNRQTETTDTGLTNYVYNANKLTSSTGEKTFDFDYDNTGNTTVENNREYIYNQNQRLIKVTDTDTVVGKYVYNGNNQRVKKIVNGQTTVFHYSLGGQLIAESDSTGMFNAEYVYLFNQPLAKIQNDNIYIYHNDHIGTPILMTDESSSVVWEEEFLPFGEPLSVTGTITNNLRFPGQYYDEETGLHYNYYRDYKPEIGRYVEADPILQPMVNSKTTGSSCAKTRISWRVPGLIFKPQSLHPFVYVGNNPVNFVDPYGLWICDAICTLIPLPKKFIPICILCPDETSLDPNECILYDVSIVGDYNFCYYRCADNSGRYGGDWDVEQIELIIKDKCEECESSFLR